MKLKCTEVQYSIAKRARHGRNSIIIDNGSVLFFNWYLMQKLYETVFHKLSTTHAWHRRRFFLIIIVDKFELNTSDDCSTAILWQLYHLYTCRPRVSLVFLSSCCEGHLCVLTFVTRPRDSCPCLWQYSYTLRSAVSPRPLWHCKTKQQQKIRRKVNTKDSFTISRKTNHWKVSILWKIMRNFRTPMSLLTILQRKLVATYLE